MSKKIKLLQQNPGLWKDTPHYQPKERHPEGWILTLQVWERPPRPRE